MDETKPETNDQLILRVKREVNGQIFSTFGNKVVRGPFTGMIIPERNEDWDDGNSSTRLLGVYEHELHDALAHAIWRRPKILINVGCAEGYYAIGFARNMPELQVYAFDINEGCCRQCRQYAELNDVDDRVNVIRGCTSPAMMCALNAPDHKLYIFDCESAELDLINLEECPSLRNADIIIECHDFLNPAISSTLADRLEATHNMTLVRPALPNFDEFAFVKQTPNLMSLLILVEMRPMPTCWLVCWAKQKGRA